MASYDDNESEGHSIEINNLVDGCNDNLNIASYDNNREIHDFSRVDLDEYDGYDDNFENNTESNKKRKFEKKKGKKPSSYVRKYFISTNGVHQCQVINPQTGRICGHKINEGITTTNRIRHLTVKHNILSPNAEEKVCFQTLFI